MKILLSADWLYPAPVGGPGHAIFHQAKALARAGHAVTVVATSQDLPPSVPINRWLALDGGRVIYTQNPHFYLPIRHVWCAAGAMRRVDVVHVNSLFYPSSFLLVMLARLLGKRVVWSPHGELSPAALQFRSRLKRGLLILFRLAGGPVVFHATSPAEVSQIRQHFGPDCPVREIHNRMELPVAVPRVARNYLLFIGRLHPIKAIDRLLEALSRSAVFRAGNHQLLIAGPDPDGYGRTLHQLATTLNLRPHVQFLGTVRGLVKEQLYADALVTILPSHSENFGNVVIESLAQGTPVIASTNTPWARLEAEGAGSWVANDPTLLGQTIDQYLRMPSDTYAAYRARALELAHRDYDIYANTAAWEALYRQAEPTQTPTAAVAVP